MKKGFTLIELLTVVSIIFLLSSIFISNAQEARNKAKDEADRQQVRQVQIAMTAFKNDKGQTPGQSYAARNYTSFNRGVYAENSDEYGYAMSELVRNKDISTIPKSSNGEAYFYVEGDDDATIITALSSEDAVERDNSCYTDNDDFECTITYNEDGSFDIDIDYKGEDLYEKKVTKDDNGNLVVNDPEQEIPEGELVTSDLMWSEPSNPLRAIWSYANNACQSHYYAGFDNWRMPTSQELIDAEDNGDIFFDPYYNYWSSTVIGKDYVSVTSGGVSQTEKSSTVNEFYCVRDVNDGDRLPPPVMWEYATGYRTGNWNTANDYCSALVNKGAEGVTTNLENRWDPISGYPNPAINYDDWRLPTVDQLKDAFATPFNNGFRSGGYYYWSGDPDTQYSPGDYWAVNNPNYADPYSGVTNGLNENYNYRCVRYAI